MDNIFFVLYNLIGAITYSSSGSDSLIRFISNGIIYLPGLLLFVLIPFVGLGIGLIKRIIKLN